MIEISHKQARYLLRESEDRRLPDEQWAALQVHLESCPDCCAYRDRMTGLEKDLRRELHGHWGAVHPSLINLHKAVIAFRTGRQQRRKWSLYSGLAVLAILAIVSFRWYAKVTAPPPTPTPKPTTQLPSPTPAQASDFHGLIAFQASPTGNSDIFLLNITGSPPNELSNLTRDPAQDTDPAWSPDGEWLAFLSDRSGKRELYVISVAGTRLTQLTNNPLIDWQAPLTWSKDGKMISLAGRRLEQNNERWLYIVPLLGTGPVSLPGTRGEPGWVHFSPSQTLLATTNNIYDYANGWSFSGWYDLPTIDNNQTAGLTDQLGLDFDWALGGNSLAYLYNDRLSEENDSIESQIRLSPVFGLNNRNSNEYVVSRIAAQAPTGSLFRSLVYLVNASGEDPYIATLIDSNHTGCWTVRIYHSVLYEQSAPIEFPGLCVENPLERANWQANSSGGSGPWLVVTARLADKATGKPSGYSGLYALDTTASSLVLSTPPAYVFLADLPQNLESSGPDSPESESVPRVRPSMSSLNIQPYPAEPPDSSQLAPSKPLPDTGALVASGLGNINSGIMRMNLDGSGQFSLTSEGAFNCPTWSPDGQMIAFTNQNSRIGSTRNEIFVMNADGRNLSQPTLPIQPGESSSTGYDCPVWSPDGRVVAAVRHDEDGSKLVVIDPEDGVQRIVPIDSPSRMALPVWTPDSKTILLAEDSSRTNSAYIVSLDWETPAVVNTLRILAGKDEIQALSISPDGKQLALIATRTVPYQQAPTADFLVLDIAESSTIMSEEIPEYNPLMQKTPGRMVWLPNNQILFTMPGGWLSASKATFVALNLTNNNFDDLSFSKDAIYDWGWKDGWLVYSSESGVWVQKLSPEEQVVNEPLRIDSHPQLRLEIR